MSINAEGVHAFGVADQALDLAFRKILDDRDKGMPKLVEAENE